MQIQQNIQTLRQALQRALKGNRDDLLTCCALLDAMYYEAEAVDRRLHKLKKLESDMKALLNDR